MSATVSAQVSSKDCDSKSKSHSDGKEEGGW
jgi:hypothetical protein